MLTTTRRRALRLAAPPRTTEPRGPSLRAYSVARAAPVPQKRKVWDSVDDAVQDVKSGDVLLSGGAHAAARGVLSAGSLTARRVRAVRHARHAHRGARTAARRHEAHGRVEQRRLGGAGARCVTPRVRARTCCPDDAGRQAAVHRADRQNDGVLHWRVRQQLTLGCLIFLTIYFLCCSNVMISGTSTLKLYT